jgi:hypothetical protein
VWGSGLMSLTASRVMIDANSWLRHERRTAIRSLERAGWQGAAMTMVQQKRKEVCRRYAIVDEAMIREAAVKMSRGAKVQRTTAQRTAQSDQPAADR